MEDIQDSPTHSKQNKWEPDSNTHTTLAAGDMKAKQINVTAITLSLQQKRYACIFSFVFVSLK